MIIIIFISIVQLILHTFSHCNRTFKFKTFLDATAFLEDVAVLSERANHHPSLLLNSASKCEQEGETLGRASAVADGLEDGCHVRVELGTFANQKVKLGRSNDERGRH